jgi:hypothetical protein
MARWILILAFALTGCSGGAGTMDRIMHSWEGAPLDAVIAQWGYPHQEQTIAGHKLYRWFYNKSAALPSTTGTTMIINGQCVRTLEVNEQNIVIRYEWSGNNCPFADILEYSNWARHN